MTLLSSDEQLYKESMLLYYFDHQQHEAQRIVFTIRRHPIRPLGQSHNVEV